MVITTGPAASPVVTNTMRSRGGRFTNSYEKEKRAMLMAVNWILEHRPCADTLVCSDSQSLLTSLVSGSADTSHIRAILDSLSGHVNIQWIPSHIDIPGNELADTAAKEATQLPARDDLRVPFGVAKAVVKREIKDLPPTPPTVSATYSNYRPARDRKVTSRKDSALLAQLRSGHCLRLGHYANRIDPGKSAKCLHCDEEDETVQHWLACPATRRTRSRIFDSPEVDLGVLTRDIRRTLAYAEATLRS